MGLVTVVTAPFVYWKLDDDIIGARFLSEEDKPKAIERLRANQTGTGTREFKWRQVLEIALDPKTYLWFALSLFLNAGAAVTNTFGPLILNGLDFDKYTTSLLNMPFGFVQFVIILIASWLTQRFRLKSVILFALIMPVIAGLAVLYAVPRSPDHNAPLLVGYYLLAFLFGGVPVTVAWVIANPGGTTKKSVMMSVYNAASSTGNIIGPLVFSADDAPEYLPGLRAILGFFIAMAGVTVIQAANLAFLNKLQERKRVRNGKPAKIQDTSMDHEYRGYDDAPDNASSNAILEDGPQEAEREHHRLGENAFYDITDRENDEFIYVL